MSDPISGTGLAGGVLTGPASMDFCPEPITAGVWRICRGCILLQPRRI